ncbi:uracil-DNA glycosylase [Orrella sp. JC864]|uniref:uracil-DNA glycosylase n=1 Tax=Orrella sp. JC864 TaxID=3120298 RepID=UPI00300B6CAC
MTAIHAPNQLLTPLAGQLAALPAAWRDCLAQPQPAQALQRLEAFLAERREQGATIYPDRPFRALELVAPEAVRVVILGQDPYHGPGQAQGLAFSVPDGVRRPPSLRNIFLEVAAEQGHPEPQTPQDAPVQGSLALEPGGAGALTRMAEATEVLQTRAATAHNDLTRWARQGVLLLNTCLTVEDGQAGAHAKRGWEAVTDALIAHVASLPEPKVFMLWGAHAQAKQALLPPGQGHRLVLAANHPSPLSARRPPVPFLGCGHFRLANAWLREQGVPPIDWQ